MPVVLPEIGDKIIFKHKVWRVIGDDRHSTAHPCALNAKWDYLLRSEEDQEYTRVTIPELEEIGFSLLYS